MGRLTVTDTVTLVQLHAWLAAFRDAVHEHAEELTALDAAIGDADHGSNLVRGTDAVMAALDPPPATASELFKSSGLALVSSVGGASGPLYGTFFLRAAAAAGDADTVDSQTLLAALRAGVDGIVDRGRAQPGDKTMYDALAAAELAMAAALDGGHDLSTATTRAAAAAREARDATAPMQARKGRASYLGERSIGHVDPGAASATLLIESLALAVGASPAA